MATPLLGGIGNAAMRTGISRPQPCTVGPLRPIVLPQARSAKLGSQSRFAVRSKAALDVSRVGQSVDGTEFDPLTNPEDEQLVKEYVRLLSRAVCIFVKIHSGRSCDDYTFVLAASQMLLALNDSGSPLT